MFWSDKPLNNFKPIQNKESHENQIKWKICAINSQKIAKLLYSSAFQLEHIKLMVYKPRKYPAIVFDNCIALYASACKCACVIFFYIICVFFINFIRAWFR